MVQRSAEYTLDLSTKLVTPTLIQEVALDKSAVIAQLLKEEKPMEDLFCLEALLEARYISEQDVIDQLIYNWGNHRDDATNRPLSMSPRPQLSLQYEDLRDGDQIGFPGVSRLSNHLHIAQHALMVLPSFGVHAADLGMPISGRREQEKILSMMKFIQKHNLPITPAVAGRTHSDDVAAIRELTRYAYKHYGLKTQVYAFVGSSRIRMLAEGQQKWNLENIARWISTTISALKKEDSVRSVIVPFEDTYGSNPKDIKTLFSVAFESGADGICICDTVSRGITLEHTQNLMRFIGHEIAPQYPDKIWEIHTHNMMGKAVQNALSAYQEGLIQTAHGTLGGVGDLGGNMPLERFVNTALEANLLSITSKKPHTLLTLTNEVLVTRNINPLQNPYAGSIYSEASRYVPTGVHASAFKRLGEFGPHLRCIFEHVYFPVAPTDLGLEIHLDVVTPTSGKHNVHAMAERLGVADFLTDSHVRMILNQAHEKGGPLTDTEFLKYFHNEKM